MSEYSVTIEVVTFQIVLVWEVVVAPELSRCH